jgi:cell division protein FtsI (penicillin-binding protein 3)
MQMEEEQEKRVLKIMFSAIMFLIGFIIFILAISYYIVSNRNIGTLEKYEKHYSNRAKIISKDGYTVAYSTKIFSAGIDSRFIESKNRELFIRLFSIYSNINERKIRAKIALNKYVILADKLTQKDAYNIRYLSNVFRRLGILYKKNSKNKKEYRAIDIQAIGEKRVYPYKDILTPIVGYMNRGNKKFARPIAVKGIEKTYNNSLIHKKDEIIKGKRDVYSHIILNKDSKSIKKIDGFDIVLNIPLDFQIALENILDKYKKSFKSKEIIASIIESKSGHVVAMASSMRFNPNKITKNSYESLNPKFVEYPFEIGSVMKPIIFASLLEEKKISTNELVKGYNGAYKVGVKTIRDEHPKDWYSAEDVIVYSSNIGIFQLAQKFNAKQISKALKNFGLTKKTNIDLPQEKIGTIPNLKQLEKSIYKGTVAYGYSINATFIQILNAYNIFNNGGVMIAPKIVSHIIANGKKFKIKNSKTRQIISSKTAKKMKKILIKTVQMGTGLNAKIDGIEIGGKTGTAHIAKNGKYVKQYISSFFGFANDKNSKYTIGVTVFEPKKEHFASSTATVVFKNIVDKMVDFEFLKKAKSKN